MATSMSEGQSSAQLARLQSMSDADFKTECAYMEQKLAHLQQHNPEGVTPELTQLARVYANEQQRRRLAVGTPPDAPSQTWPQPPAKPETQLQPPPQAAPSPQPPPPTQPPPSPQQTPVEPCAPTAQAAAAAADADSPPCPPPPQSPVFIAPATSFRQLQRTQVQPGRTEPPVTAWGHEPVWDVRRDGVPGFTAPKCHTAQLPPAAKYAMHNNRPCAELGSIILLWTLGEHFPTEDELWRRSVYSRASPTVAPQAPPPPPQPAPPAPAPSN